VINEWLTSKRLSGHSLKRFEFNEIDKSFSGPEDSPKIKRPNLLLSACSHLSFLHPLKILINYYSFDY